MRINFWTSTEYGGFMNALMLRLIDNGIKARQIFNISEESYRSARSTPQRLLLRFRQYILYQYNFRLIYFMKHLKETLISQWWLLPILLLHYATFFNSE